MNRTPSGIPNDTGRKLNGLFVEQCMEGVEGGWENGSQDRLPGTGVALPSLSEYPFKKIREAG